MADRIRREWDAYVRDVVPPDAPAVQVHECRQAFFSGAVATFMEMTGGLTTGSAVQKADLKMMADLHSELLAFTRDALQQAEAETEPGPVDRLDQPAHPAPGRLEVEAMGRGAIRRCLEGLPVDVICTLFLTRSGPQGFLTYISNGDRQDMVRSVVEWLGRIASASPEHRADVKAALDDLMRGS